MLTSAWPLFGLELRRQDLVLRPPTDADFPALLDAIDSGIHPPEVMPFSQPWTDAAPAVRRRAALQFWWRGRATWTPQQWNLLLLVERDGQAVGVQEVFARQWDVLRQVGTGSWLTRSAQGQGVGKQMRTAVLDLAFHHLGAVRAHTEAFADNAASAGVSRALGYRPNGSSWEAPRGTPQELLGFVLDRADWLARGAPETQVMGLDACLPDFGLGVSTP